MITELTLGSTWIILYNCSSMEANGSQTKHHSQSWIHSIQSHNCNPWFAGAPPPFFAAAVPYNPSNPTQQFLANSLPLSCTAPISFSYTAPALLAGTPQLAEHLIPCSLVDWSWAWCAIWKLEVVFLAQLWAPLQSPMWSHHQHCQALISCRG